MTDEEFEKIMKRHINSVLRLAYSYLKSMAEAEDAAQEVFLSLFCSKTAFHSHIEEKAWLMKVTVNTCINRLRSPWFSRRTGSDIPEDIMEDFPENEKEALMEVMSLPEKYRTVIHLFYYEGYSVREIAKITGVAESTVRTRLQRGRERLRLVLTDRQEAAVI
ncbi:MAG: RNA polymerase sigma factor [Huintestinicola sp.]